MKRDEPCYLHCPGVFEVAFEKYGYTVLVCSVCDLYALETQSNYDHFIQDYYKEGYFKGNDDKYGYADYMAEEPMIRTNARHYLERIKKFIQHGALLDVGCAAGYFLDEAQHQGFAVSGIDASDYITKQAPVSVLQSIHAVPLHLAKFSENYFDIVTMFDLIEHLADPRTDISVIAKSMKKDALLVIGTGDVGSFYSQILGRHNHFFAPPHHFFFFSKKTMRQLLYECGFEVFRIEHIGKWLTYPYIARVSKHFAIPFLEKILNSNLFMKLLSHRWFYLYFGDNMVVYARKIDISS